MLTSAPVVNTFVMPATRAPLPIWSPVGTWRPAAASDPGARWLTYSRSWKSAWPFLNPLVFTFAMLFDVLSIAVV